MATIQEEPDKEQLLDDVFAELRRGVVDKRHPFRYFALATVQDGGTGLRTVVLRRVDAGGHLWIYTDARSSKVASRDDDSDATMLFYHDRQKFQVRITAEVKVHRGDAVCSDVWRDLSEYARKSYTSVVPPGTAIDGPAEAHRWNHHTDDSHFSMMELVPSELEVLQLDGYRHLRILFTRRSNGWSGHWIAP